MNVIFVEPFFPRNQREFARALAEAGATVIGVGEYPIDSLGVEAGYMASAYVRMRHPDYDVLHEMLDTVGRTLRVYAS